RKVAPAVNSAFVFSEPNIVMSTGNSVKISITDRNIHFSALPSQADRRPAAKPLPAPPASALFIGIPPSSIDFVQPPRYGEIDDRDQSDDEPCRESGRDAVADLLIDDHRPRRRDKQLIQIQEPDFRLADRTALRQNHNAFVALQ